MIALADAEISGAIERVAQVLPKYCWIQDHVRVCDVSKDTTFQRRYKGFYRVRRGVKWCQHYFEIMQSAKPGGITFLLALRAMKERTGRLEASFSSKLVATLDPTKPVIDQFVLKRFDLRLPYHSARNREFKIGGVYDQLCRRYEELLDSAAGRMLCQRFDQLYPNTTLSDLKKIDLVLWQARVGA